MSPSAGRVYGATDTVRVRGARRMEVTPPLVRRRFVPELGLGRPVRVRGMSFSWGLCGWGRGKRGPSPFGWWYYTEAVSVSSSGEFPRLADGTRERHTSHDRAKRANRSKRQPPKPSAPTPSGTSSDSSTRPARPSPRMARTPPRRHRARRWCRLRDAVSALPHADRAPRGGLSRGGPAAVRRGRPTHRLRYAARRGAVRVAPRVRQGRGDEARPDGPAHGGARPGLDLFATCKQMVKSTGGRLVERAQEARASATTSRSPTS